MIPTITLNMAGKKAVFVGRAETAVDKIYCVEDTLDSITVYGDGDKYNIPPCMPPGATTPTVMGQRMSTRPSTP